MKTEIEDYLTVVKNRIDKTKKFTDPYTGKEYTVTEWKDANSSMDESRFLKVDAPLIRGYKGTSYFIKKGFLRPKTRLVISLMDIDEERVDLQKITENVERSIKKGVTYIFCLPTADYRDWKFPTIQRVYYIVADIKKQNVYTDETAEFKGVENYKNLFMPKVKDIRTSMSVQKVQGKVEGYVTKEKKLTYSFEELSNKLKLPEADIEKAAASLEKSRFLSCRIETVDGKRYLYLFSVLDPKSTEEEKRIRHLEGIIAKLTGKKDEKELEQYKKEVNVLDIKIQQMLEKREKEHSILNEWYSAYKSQKNADMIDNIRQMQNRLAGYMESLRTQKERIERLKGAIAKDEKELVPKDVVGEEKSLEISEEAKIYKRMHSLTEILLNLNIPDDEMKQLLKIAEKEGWWLDEWESEDDLVCPNCATAHKSDSREIQTSAGKRTIHYCNNCGYVW